MTLTTRLLVFFLATLAAVLAGFSLAVYFLAGAHLHRQSQARLDAALNTLVAAAEFTADAVEWEPEQRRMLFTGADPADRTLWLVRAEHGRIVDGVEPPSEREAFSSAVSPPTDRESAEPLTWRNQSWLVRQQWIRPGDLPGAPLAQAPNPADPHRFPALILTAAVSLEPNQATLRQLALALGGLSLVVWLVAAFVGRSVCRRGLRPVTQMAAAARDMSASDLADRLPRVANGDELDDLSQSFNGLLDRLQESFERQRRFTGDASHQLRTPLTAILGQLEVALRRDRTADEYRTVVATVHEKAGRLQHIVESLLFLARADADALLPEREPTDLADWLPEHLRTWANHPRADDLTFEPAGGPSLRARATRHARRTDRHLDR